MWETIIVERFEDGRVLLCLRSTGLKDGTEEKELGDGKPEK